MIDASVAVKLVLPREQFAETAESLLAAGEGSRRGFWIAPDLFDIECASAMVAAVRRGRVEPDAAEGGVAYLLALPIVRHHIGGLLPLALRLSLRLTVSIYDACYVALADVLGLPLVTADEKLVRAAYGTRHAVIGLGDLGV